MENYKMLVTPEVAASLLEKVPEYQRRASSAFVDMYASDMENGRWNEALGCRIIIGKNGELMDGQHRMMAIVKSGKSYMFDVLEGLDESEFTKIDQGKTRTANDFASKKYGNSSEVCSIARAMLGIEKKLGFKRVVSNTQKFSSPEVIEYIDKNQEEINDFLFSVKRLASVSGRQRIPAYVVVRSVCDWKFGNKSVDFFKKLNCDDAFDNKYAAKAVSKIASCEKIEAKEMASILFTACEAYVYEKGVRSIVIDDKAIKRLESLYEAYTQPL